MIVCWAKPAILTPYVPESGTVGIYVPNMSLWQGIIRHKNTTNPFVELRKTFNRDGCYAQIFVIVAIDGYTYKNQKPVDTKSTNIRISMNGPVAMTFAEHIEMNRAVEEALQKILQLQPV